MARPRRYKAKQVIEALKTTRGIKSDTCNILKCARNTLDKYIRDFPSVAQAYHDVVETRHDFAESKILKLIGDENPTILIFYAKCQMKHRGYVERDVVTWEDFLRQMGADPKEIFEAYVNFTRDQLRSDKEDPIHTV